MVYLLRSMVAIVRLGRTVARPGVRDSDGTTGAAAAAEQCVEEGVDGLRQEDDAEGHDLQRI